MPVMDGILCTSLLREKGYVGPIVAVTADVTSETRESCSKLMDAFLLKPVTKKSLVDLFRQFRVGEKSQVATVPATISTMTSTTTTTTSTTTTSTTTTAATTTSTTPPSPSATSALDGSKLAFLVADDMPSNRVFVEFLLAKKIVPGARIDLVSDGVEAVKFARERNDYAMIFLDLHMPRCSGREAALQIRKFNKEVPMIGLSGTIMTQV